MVALAEAALEAAAPEVAAAAASGAEFMTRSGCVRRLDQEKGGGGCAVGGGWRKGNERRSAMFTRQKKICSG
jgi:hypothetical protein